MLGDYGTSAPEVRKEIAVARLLFLASAALWLVIGVASLMRLAALSPGQAATLRVVALLVFGNAGAMALVGVGLGWRTRLFGILGLAVLFVNIVLTFTDQFGVLDLITLVIDLILFGLLVRILLRFRRARLAKRMPGV